MLIVYRKSNGEILLNTGKSFVKPEGMSDYNGKLAVIERIGGSVNDYGTFRLHDINEKEKVDEILRYENYVELILDNGTVTDYKINYEKYEQDKRLLVEQGLLESLIPSDKEVLFAEMDLKMITILQEADLI